ncbi:MAG TPA: hypothetical protein VFS27_01280 [Blastocatellia bacterium]|jgi:ElaB/YqjD/DUF883 family membrane-anchored ribosome-binding protein|nr:hypothetical protein [Blastocatellia bacterium]
MNHRTEHEGGFEIEHTGESAGGGHNGGRHRETIFKQIRTTAADKLQAAAQTLHQKADRSSQPTEISALGHRAADWLERSADYVNEIEPQRLKSDLESQVRRNPGRSLIIAGIVGLALGGLLRRK